MTGIRAVLLGFIALFLVRSDAAIGSPYGEPVRLKDLVLSNWTLQSLGETPADSDAILQIAEESFSLDVPCFRQSWAYGYSTGELKFSNPDNYQNRCNGEMPSEIKSFNSAVPRIRSAAINGETLSLLDDAGSPLIVVTRFVPSGIENRRWHISAFFDGKSLVPTRSAFSYPLATHIMFIHGSVMGSSGCGGMFGGYSLRDEQISVTAFSYLAGMCPLNEFAPNSAVLGAINGDRLIDQDDDEIQLLDDDGRVQIVLSPYAVNAQ